MVDQFMPCRRGFVAALVAAVAARRAWAGGADPLRRYRWVSRVLLVFAGTERDPDLATQRQDLAQVGQGLKERDLVVIEVVGATLRTSAGRAEGSPQALRARFRLPADRFRVILVGKDGDAKFSGAKPIAADRLFGIIDAMPMRQDEMRGQ